MTADIDAALSRLRERPECRDAVEVIERLTAERDAWEAKVDHFGTLFDLASKTLAKSEAERDRLREREGQMTRLFSGVVEGLIQHCEAYGIAEPVDEWWAHASDSWAALIDEAMVGLSDAAAALGESPVPDEPAACEYLPGAIGSEHHCTHWQDAVDDDVTACCWCGTDEDDAGSCPGPAAPSHPTGEERTDGD